MPKVNVVFDELQLSGEDAESFLQGQTTADVRFSEGEVRLTAFCTAKGKVLSSGFCWRKGQSFHLLLLPGEGEFLQAQLKKYRLRAKVEFSSSVCQGQAFIDPAQQDTFRHTDHFIALLPGLGIELQKSAMDGITEPSLWQRALIEKGLVLVDTTLRERFLPQMLNYDQFNAIGFAKGCYLGQEVIARASLRGEVKRRARPFISDRALKIGDLLSLQPEKGAYAEVISVAPYAESGSLALIVLPVEGTAGCFYRGIEAVHLFPLESEQNVPLR
jgi:hypothetical protein